LQGGIDFGHGVMFLVLQQRRFVGELHAAVDARRQVNRLHQVVGGRPENAAVDAAAGRWLQGIGHRQIAVVTPHVFVQLARRVKLLVVATRAKEPNLAGAH